MDPGKSRTADSALNAGKPQPLLTSHILHSLSVIVEKVFVEFEMKVNSEITSGWKDQGPG
jgi:hypothetical protein